MLRNRCPANDDRQTNQPNRQHSVERNYERADSCCGVVVVGAEQMPTAGQTQPQTPTTTTADVDGGFVCGGFVVDDDDDDDGSDSCCGDGGCCDCCVGCGDDCDCSWNSDDSVAGRKKRAADRQHSRTETMPDN